MFTREYALKNRTQQCGEFKQLSYRGTASLTLPFLAHPPSGGKPIEEGGEQSFVNGKRVPHIQIIAGQNPETCWMYHSVSWLDLQTSWLNAPFLGNLNYLNKQPKEQLTKKHGQTHAVYIYK